MHLSILSLIIFRFSVSFLLSPEDGVHENVHEISCKYVQTYVQTTLAILVRNDIILFCEIGLCCNFAVATEPS